MDGARRGIYPGQFFICALGGDAKSFLFKVLTLALVHAGSDSGAVLKLWE